MLIVDTERNITVSRGDVLDLAFNLEGLQIESTDRICFSVKKNVNDAATCLCMDCTSVNVEENTINVYATSAAMEALHVGKYYYDLVIIRGENKRALNFPARLIVAEVVHNE